MIPRIVDDFSTLLLDRSTFILEDEIPPRDPNDDDDDEDEDGEDEKHPDEPAVVREPDDDE